MKLQRARLAATVALAVMAGCTSIAERSQVPVKGDVEIWEYPASAYPAMCIVLSPDGRATFVGAYQHYNPSTWSAEQNGESLTLALPPRSEWHSELLAGQLHSNPSTVISANEQARRITYRVLYYNDRPNIVFMGFNFYKVGRCSAG